MSQIYIYLNLVKFYLFSETWDITFQHLCSLEIIFVMQIIIKISFPCFMATFVTTKYNVFQNTLDAFEFLIREEHRYIYKNN